MGLKVTQVSKCLDKKAKLFGFEMGDLFIVFFSLAILNFIFGKTDQKLLLVWLPPALIGLSLHFGKKGKPDNYIVHWFRFQFSPGVYSAFKEPTENPFPPTTNKYKERI